MPPMLDTRREVMDRTRDLRNTMRALGPRCKARDIALGIYDQFRFSGTLTRLLMIDSLTAVARAIIQSERAAQVKMTASAGASVGPEFPQFAEICAECPNNYALPGDEPEDTIYIETFDGEWELLDVGADYLDKHAHAELRHAAALRGLSRLCRRLGAAANETPREILRRNGFTI